MLRETGSRWSHTNGTFPYKISHLIHKFTNGVSDASETHSLGSYWTTKSVLDASNKVIIYLFSLFIYLLSKHHRCELVSMKCVISDLRAANSKGLRHSLVFFCDMIGYDNGKTCQWVSKFISQKPLFWMQHKESKHVSPRGMPRLQFFVVFRGLFLLF